MTLSQLLVFTAIALFAWFVIRFLPARVSGYSILSTLRAAHLLSWVMLVVSVLALYWLQSATPIRQLDFWLPTASLGLTVMVWCSTCVPVIRDLNRAFLRATLMAAAVLVVTIAAIALTRYVAPLCCLTPTRPPEILVVIVGLAVITAFAAGAAWVLPRHLRWLAVPAMLILGLFVVLKLDALGQVASAGLRVLTGQATDQASPLDLRWLGFSYIAFRLVHVLRDRMTGKLGPQAYSLKEFVIYVVFFPALTAGPIDRIDRFTRDYRAATKETVPAALPPASRPAAATPAVKNTRQPTLSEDFVEGSRRIITGVFKKFVLADTLAVVALNSINATQTTSTFWMWALVYAYAFRILFDFSGYTDIAIGLGRFFGIRLPENFEQPYLKTNLTVFWNSWHITLAQWFRTYFFNPVTRALRTSPMPWGKPLTPVAIILVGQVGTMLLIGLWHGITWNFIAWGLWHAAGLFVHSRWVDYNRRIGQADNSTDKAGQVTNSPHMAKAVGIVLTFNYVALGWVWFALPSMDLSLGVFRKLMGLG